jgi:predicted Zn finger-like uncharacterized protein
VSLATRCTACGTVFRVVQDQLKISEGWVRCGRCQEVFNAVEGLFDLDREAPPAWPQPMTPSAEPMPVPQEPAPSEELLAPDEPASPRPAPPDEAETHSPQDFADARFPSEMPPDAEPAHGDTEAVDDTAVPTLPPADAEPAPHFVLAAERAARWEQPRTRAGLALAALVLGVLLLLQIGGHFRTDVTAAWKPARPLLDGWCAVARCNTEAPRRLEPLAVDSSGLVRLDAGGLYRFDLVLRNRASHDVMLPALELTLTDAAGAVVARKVVRPSELGAPRGDIAGGAEVPLRAMLATGDARIAGYTVDLFYP